MPVYYVKYDLKKEIITIIFDGLQNYETYTKAWEEALELIEKHNVSRLVLDSRKDRVLSQNIQRWMKEELFSIIEEKVHRLPHRTARVARLESENIFNNLFAEEARNYLEKSNFSYRYKTFRCPEEAMNWLVRPL